MNTGGPAFPHFSKSRQHSDGYNLYQGIEEGMTLRQYAAIKLRVPDSGTDWLDDMIRASLRDDVAAKAIQGFCSNPNAGNNPADTAKWLRDYGAVSAYQMADAMLRAREA